MPGSSASSALTTLLSGAHSRLDALLFLRRPQPWQGTLLSPYSVLRCDNLGASLPWEGLLE